MDNYYVFACDSNGNKTCVYVDKQYIARVSPINRISNVESIPKLVKFAMENYHADHVEVRCDY